MGWHTRLNLRRIAQPRVSLARNIVWGGD